MMTINILFLTSVPKNEASLALNTEFRQIEETLDESAYTHRFRLFRYARLRRDELERTLEAFQPHIVHFCGHGSPNGALLLEAPDGQRWDLDRDTLRTVFKGYGKSVRLAVLNACHSEVAGNTLREVIPYVVGNAIAVYDSAAIEFSTVFYKWLFAGESLHKSFREACRAVTQLDKSRGQVPQLLDTPRHPDPRQVKPYVHWHGSLLSADALGHQLEDELSRSQARELLNQYLKLDIDFDAFAIEKFPEVYRRWSSGMERIAKENLLLVLHRPKEIAAALVSFSHGSRQCRNASTSG